MQYSSVVIVSYLCDFGRDILLVILSSLVKLDALRGNTETRSDRVWKRRVRVRVMTDSLTGLLSAIQHLQY